MSEKIKAIRDAIIAHCEHRDGQFYATPKGVEAVQKILDDLGIQGYVTIGEDGRFLVTVKARHRS